MAIARPNSVTNFALPRMHQAQPCIFDRGDYFERHSLDFLPTFDAFDQFRSAPLDRALDGVKRQVLVHAPQLRVQWTSVPYRFAGRCDLRRDKFIVDFACRFIRQIDRSHSAVNHCR